MSYELLSTGEENEYSAFADGEVLQKDIDQDTEKESEWIKSIEDALAYLEETKEARLKEDELADFLAQGGQSVEIHIEEDSFQKYYKKREEEFVAALEKAKAEANIYKELFITYQKGNNASEENKKRISELESEVIELTNKVQEEQKKFSLLGKHQIDVKEFEILFSVSESLQKSWRGRHIDPLPYQQYGDNGKIFYNLKEVLKWMENYAK